MVLGKGSNKKVEWICPNCGNIVYYNVNKVCKYGYIPCKRCSDKISYPNKFMYNLLEQLNVEFTTEYSPDWIKPKRYDFFLPQLNCIIEMDGALGHGNKTIGNLSDKETLLIDNYKDDMAIQHGYKVVRINSYYSDLNYIKNNIYNSELSTLFNLNNVDFFICNKQAQSSYKMKVCECWNKHHEMNIILSEFKFARGTIIRWLKDCAKYGLCDYNAKEQMIRSGQRNISKAYNSNKKQVICLETQQVFESCKEAYKWLGYNVDGHSIQDNCKNITKSAGKHPETHERLHWMFYCDYISRLDGDAI